MNITSNDLWWLWKHQPLLTLGAGASSVHGTLRVSTYYDSQSGRIVSGRRLTALSHRTFVFGQFEIKIRLDALDANGWPKVFEAGMLHRSIAKRHAIQVADLHFYSSGYACLGIRYPWDPPFTLDHFVAEMVEPFFYRLAYVDLYGLKAARADLWPEYSHGILGLVEHLQDVRRGPHGLLAGN